MPHRTCALLVIAILLLSSQIVQAGLKIFYIRHAEGGHQVVDQFRAIPKSEWPAYAGNGDLLTPHGEQQAESLAKELRLYHFDFIAVSPYLRCQRTILPYLLATGQKAEIWPELEEISGIGMGLPAASLPPPSDYLYRGQPIAIAPEAAGAFTLRPGAPNWLDFGKDEAQIGANSREAIRQTIRLLLKRFGGQDKSVLLVGHTEAGKYLLRALVDDDTLLQYGSEYGESIPNAAMWMAEQEPGGRFKLWILNDQQYAAVAR